MRARTASASAASRSSALCPLASSDSSAGGIPAPGPIRLPAAHCKHSTPSHQTNL